MGMNDLNSLSHSRWNCKYHIVFAPKYRRKVFYKEKRAAIGKILRELCEWKGVRNQLKEDEMGEQMKIASASPFTGGK